MLRILLSSEALSLAQIDGLARHLASLIVRMLDNVPLGSRLGRNAVLFLRTMEKIRSSWALECGIKSASIAILESLEKRAV